LERLHLGLGVGRLDLAAGAAPHVRHISHPDLRGEEIEDARSPFERRRKDACGFLAWRVGRSRDGGKQRAALGGRIWLRPSDGGLRGRKIGIVRDRVLHQAIERGRAKEFPPLRRYLGPTNYGPPGHSVAAPAKQEIRDRRRTRHLKVRPNSAA